MKLTKTKVGKPLQLTVAGGGHGGQAAGHGGHAGHSH